MNGDNNFFFVDGASLLADFSRAKTSLSLGDAARLDIRRFAAVFAGKRFYEFHAQTYRRFTFYFVRDDARIESLLKLPDFQVPGEVSDLRIEECGRRIQRSEKARLWLDQNHAPPYVCESLYRSEKAVDTQICCDALQLAATGKLDRLFSYTNDFDFVPLCGALRQLGANINLLRLRAERVNHDLVRECDAFHAMSDDELRSCVVTEPAEPSA